MQHEKSKEKKVRTKISKGFQVVVPSELRKRYGVTVGDEVLWEFSTDNEISVQLQKKPSLRDLIALGRGGKKSSSVELKKKIQKGDI